jgi:ADP-ribose pyrophosphatase
MTKIKNSTNLKISFHQADQKILAQERKYDGFFKIDSYQIQHSLFAGGQSDVFTRELFERGEAAAVVLYDPVKDIVVLTEQYRIGAAFDAQGASPWLFEVVAGIVEEGEHPEDVARREALEEANCELAALLPISSYWSSPGGSSEKIHLYCALVDSTGLGGIHGLADENEDIRVHLIPFDQAYQAIESGEINNAATIIALQWVKLNQNQLKQDK